MKNRTFRLNKLVRDKIVKHHFDMGGAVDFHILPAEKRAQALVRKLAEEVRELKSSHLSESEIADLQEIIDQLVRELGLAKASIKSAQIRKRQANGAFKKGHYIETVTLPGSNKWAKYYAADPKRFPELK